MPNVSSLLPFTVIAHTDEVLVIQTHSGTKLSTVVDKASQNDSFGKFNLGLHVSDDPEQVLRNRAKLLRLINEYGFNNRVTNDFIDEKLPKPTTETIYWLNQIHSDRVIRIGESKGGSTFKQTMQSGLCGLVGQPPSADALVTSESNQALAIMTADCVPIAIYDPNSDQVAAIHAGWQGLVNGVIFETINELEKFNPASIANGAGKTFKSATSERRLSQAKPIQAWMGACISLSSYEVSNEVVDKLMLGCEKQGMDIKVLKETVVANHEDPNKAWLDIPKLAELQLNQLGIDIIKPKGIATSGPALACSYKDNRFYSYRRKTHLGERHTGRMALLIVKY